MTAFNHFYAAHSLVTEVLQNGDNYAATFGLCLKAVYQSAPAVPVEPSKPKQDNEQKKRQQRRRRARLARRGW